MDKLRLAIVSDIHHGGNTEGKQGDKALGLLTAFVNEVNSQEADLVVDLGDRISDVDKATDIALQQEVAAVFEKLTVPHVHLLGNHDMDHLSREDNAYALGQPVAHQSQDIKGIHLVFWKPDAYFRRGFRASEEQLEWLRQDLASTNLPSIIFSHAPYSDAAMTSHFYFQNAPREQAGYANATAIREISSSYGHVIACITGHVHWNSWHSISGIHHLTIQSLSEGWTTGDEAAESWAWLEVGEALSLSVRGKDPLEISLALRSKEVPWHEPIRFD